MWGIFVSPQNGTIPERIFIQTLGCVLADDIYIYIYIYAHDALPLEIKILGLDLFQSVQTFPYNVQIFCRIYKLSCEKYRPTKTSNFKRTIFHKNSKFLFIDSSKPIYKINKNFYKLFTNSAKKFLSKYNISILRSNQI